MTDGLHVKSQDNTALEVRLHQRAGENLPPEPEVVTNGGPAFPHGEFPNYINSLYVSHSGMSLRAYLTAAALTGLLASVMHEDVPAWAVKIADDTLAELSKTPNTESQNG